MGCIPLAKEDIDFHENKQNAKCMESPVGKFIIELDSLYLEKLEDKVERKEHLMIVFKLSNQEHRINLK